MRTTRLLLGLTVWLLGTLAARGQHVPMPYSIQLSARSSTSGTDFRVEVTRKADVVHLRYARLDSVQNGRLRADPHYAAYQSLLQANQLPAAERAAIMQRFVALLEQYKVYRWDSLQVATSRHRPLRQLLDSVYTSSAAHLERADANRGRIVLDGTFVHVVVKTGDHLDKDVAVDSPSPVSHPQLYRLLHETLQLYRQAHPVSFLDPRFTSGY